MMRHQKILRKAHKFGFLEIDSDVVEKEWRKGHPLAKAWKRACSRDERGRRLKDDERRPALVVTRMVGGENTC